MTTQRLVARQLLPNTTIRTVAANAATGRVVTIGFTPPDGKGRTKQKLTVFDLDGVRLKELAYPGRNGVEHAAIAFSPDGSRLAAGATSVQVFDASSWKKVQTLKVKGDVMSLAFGDDNQLVVRTREESAAFSVAGERLSDVPPDLASALSAARPVVWHYEQPETPATEFRVLVAKWGLEIADETGVLQSSRGPYGLVSALREEAGKLECYLDELKRWVDVETLARSTRDAVLASPQASAGAVRTLVETEAAKLRVRNDDGVLEFGVQALGETRTERLRYPRNDLTAFYVDPSGAVVGAFGKGEFVVFDAFEAREIASLTPKLERPTPTTAVYLCQDGRLLFAQQSGEIHSSTDAVVARSPDSQGWTALG